MTSPVSEDIKFEGEDANAGLAAPLLDLIAAALLLLTAALVMVASLRLPVPGSILTAPGLLPFAAGASLAVMAVILGNSAIARRKTERGTETLLGDTSEQVRMLALAAMVSAYVLGLQFLPFQLFFTVAGVPFVLSAFEPVTFIALTAIMHMFWRGPLWAKAAIASAWTITLSVTFQKLFNIPLPGGF